MNKEEIFKSGFVRAFIEEYYERMQHSYYPPKDRLNYTLCKDDDEKKVITTKEIEKAKDKIKELGNEELSFGYIMSYKDKNSPSYIEPLERHSFWLRRFSEEFDDSIISYTPIYDAVLRFFEKQEIDKDCFENEDEFWNFYPESISPENAFLPDIVVGENELLALIEFTIEEYLKDEWWEFDFEDFAKYRSISHSIDTLFELSELFVQLNRLEMFQDFLTYDNIEEEPTKNLFSALEWATIFYYAHETNLLDNENTIVGNIEIFMSKHQVKTSAQNFKVKYYEAKNRINKKNDYPIKKLNTIVPFLKEHYNHSVDKVENDIIFLEQERLDY